MTFNDIAKVTDQNAMKKKTEKNKGVSRLSIFSFNETKNGLNVTGPMTFGRYFWSVDFEDLLNAIDLESLLETKATIHILKSRIQQTKTTRDLFFRS